MNQWQQFTEWLFDGKKDSKIPDELTKHSSKVSQLYALKMFRNNGKLNHYLNNCLNTFDIFYVDKEELFYFLKKCVRDYKVKRKSVPYFKGSKKDRLFNTLKGRYPLLKNEDVEVLSELIQNSNKKNEIMVGLGLETDHKKKKVPKSKKKENNTENERKDRQVSLSDFLTKNFVCMEIE